ncbi:RNA 2'-phosphotransferase [Lysinibacillus agricola]|uniref:Probable RNA 2'-phosphotransferase n=1 Tax=Lysinibacillus agricola TaxID=2590012 RepID=A0ABX7AQH8_9BACI|nr:MULTISPECIES: RNA 2'-phosphotransferase [Lysinibacillus]KOS60593.1 RNA 2'-phosphotransferase [Lysinibacillus sp. FJAT-14222]QQP11163.1 RNA 2'-phosphotransferase [Lysinibacillus agricola]
MAYEELSKEVSYALRHAPWEYELEMDDEGWVSLEQLRAAFSATPKWRQLEVNEFIDMVNMAEKKRHEIHDNKIRALYGHSNSIHKIAQEERIPPNVLYHGTAKRFLEKIKIEGLLPRSRQYVHLSVDTETATLVGKRRDNEPRILKINAKEAYDQGVKFYYGNDNVWLVDSIDAKYIDDSW